MVHASENMSARSESEPRGEPIGRLCEECSEELDQVEHELIDVIEGRAQQNRQQSTADSAAEPSMRRNSAGRLKILLAEDDFTSRVILQGLLRAYGDCHIAVNGKEAVGAFHAALERGEGYDLICMDVRMPGMDGTDAVREIRGIEEARKIYSTSGVRIFMTTAAQDMKTVKASYWALCDAYLFKPIDGAQLEQHLLAFRLIQDPASSGAGEPHP